MKTNKKTLPPGENITSSECLAKTPDYYVKCNATGTRISPLLICNGDINCEDGEDEDVDKLVDYNWKIKYYLDLH